MTNKEEFSRTMRIDLIPSVPEGSSGGKDSVVISGATGGAARQDADRSETNFHKLLQALYDAVIVSDQEGKIVDVNLRAEEFFRYMKSEVTGLSVLDVISGADESLLDTLNQNLKGERFTLIQAYCIRADGSYFPAEIAVSKLDFEAPQLCFFVRDITVRRQAQEMLITEHNAIQNSSTGIVITNTLAVIEFANPATAKMWSCQNERELLDIEIGNLLDEPGVVDTIVQALGDDESDAWHGDLVGKRSDESCFDIEVSAVPSRNADGEVVGYVFSLADIGDRKRAQEAEQESERRRVMLESLGAACHHVSQPATILMGNLEILRERLSSDDEEIGKLVQGSLDAMESIDDVLQRLKSASEYKTRSYLGPPDDPDAEENRILDI